MPRPPNNVPRCQDDGIIGTVTGMAGIIISNELIKNSVGISSDLKGKVLIINLENLLFRKVKIKISKFVKIMGKFLLYVLLSFYFKYSISEVRSLKNTKVNVRLGPSKNYPIKFVYEKNIYQL